MNDYLNESVSKRIRILLAVLLLAAQGLAFAHDVDHLAAPENGACVTCPMFSSADPAPTPGTAGLPVAVESGSPCLACRQFTSAQASFNQAARAPPSR